MNFLKKLQNQPEDVKKIIVWTIVIILGLILFVWWSYRSYGIITGFSGAKKEKFMEQIKLPALESEAKEGLKGIEKPKEIFNELGQELKKIEELEKNGEKIPENSGNENGQ